MPNTRRKAQKLVINFQRVYLGMIKDEGEAFKNIPILLVSLIFSCRIISKKIDLFEFVSIRVMAPRSLVDTVVLKLITE